MGYTHYYKTEKRLNKEQFSKVVEDFKKCVPYLERLGVTLAGPMGKGKPKITENLIAFNGVEKCGHTQRDLGITWPADNARGIGVAYEEEKFEQDSEKKLEGITGKDGTMTVLCGNPIEWIKSTDVKGTWFAGAKLSTRTCGGNCSHESFVLNVKMRRSNPIEEIAYYKADGTPVKNNPKEVGKYFNFTKTAYKPYDLAVNVALIIAKHHLKDQIIVSSDGKQKDWIEGMFICNTIMGYGKEFNIKEGD